MMKKYCKAYHVRDLRQFVNWTESKDDQEADLSEDEVVYLWDDFTVVRSPVIPEKGLIFDNVTPEWQDFCKMRLYLEIPEDLRYAYEQAEEENHTVSEEIEKPTSA